jgi:hypothetical protein
VFFIRRTNILLFLLAILFLNPSLLHAVGASFRLEQSKIKLSIPAGGSKAGEIKIYNQSNEAIGLKAYLEDWAYTNEQDGSKDFFPAGSTQFSCASWIKFYPAQFTLAPYGVSTVNYTVNVPQEATGGHYAVMFFETLPQPIEQSAGQEGITSGVGLAIRLGSLIYIEAKDTVKRSVELNNFSVYKDTKDRYLFIASEFKNTGNTDITIAGSFHIMDKEGVVYARGEFNAPYTFAGDTAKLEAVWKKPLAAGKYDLVITLDLGKAQEEGGIGRGPVIIKESQIEIGSNGEVLRVGELR